MPTTSTRGWLGRRAWEGVGVSWAYRGQGRGDGTGEDSVSMGWWRVESAHYVFPNEVVYLAFS